MKLKKINVFGIVGAIFGSVGIIMFIVSMFIMVRHVRFNKSNPATEAVITSIERSYTGKRNNRKTTHKVYVSYTVDGEEYETLLGYYTRSMKSGDTVTVHYQESDPNKIMVKNYTVEYILIPLSAFFLILDVGIFTVSLKRKKREKYLRENGQREIATVTGVVEDMHTTVNGVHPKMIECEIFNQYTGQRHIYRSQSVMNDLSQFIGMPVDVYIDTADNTKAFVDLEKLAEGPKIYLEK